MSAQANDFSRYTQQFAAAANRANRLTLENAESVFGMQLRALERNTNATAGFFGELSSAGAQVDLQALLPKGLQVARDNFERLATASQEAFGLSLKTGEALGELARKPFAPAPNKAERTTR
ncbi:phasin family protein [Stenotrophomonas sp. SY1]|uniref:phasin family protein n=1 Tax=Stenotrophomonas sp. SY1 TaxID=477235 RepID=UPI001E5DC0B8|nr:phasin family protein [Stenotrophomonas sp. SY1]MCD9085865.1 phasin family protein [Stenotrophomonas sp. SY1]